MQRILVVEDEALLLQSMTASLSTLSEVDVAGVSGVAAAIENLEQAAPDLLVTDLSLPDGSGLQVIERVERLGRPIPIIIQTGQLSQYRDALPRNARLVVLEKPVSMKELRNQVSVQLGGSQQGQHVDPFGLVDYLQLAAFSRRSLLLTVRDRGGGSGQVVIVDGDVWQARFNHARGVEAVAAMATASLSAIEVDELHNPPGEREVLVSTQGLLMELARIEDEARHYGRAPEAPSLSIDDFADPFAGAEPRTTAADLPDVDDMLGAFDALVPSEAAPSSIAEVATEVAADVVEVVVEVATADVHEHGERLRDVLTALARGGPSAARERLTREPLAADSLPRWLRPLLDGGALVEPGRRIVQLLGFAGERSRELGERLARRGLVCVAADPERLLRDSSAPALLAIHLDEREHERPFAALEALWAMRAADRCCSWIAVASTPTRYVGPLCAALSALAWLGEERDEASEAASIDEQLAALAEAWLAVDERPRLPARPGVLELLLMLANLGVDAALQIGDGQGQRARLEFVAGDLRWAAIEDAAGVVLDHGLSAVADVLRWPSPDIDLLAVDPQREPNLSGNLAIVLAALLRALPGPVNRPTEAAREQEQAMSNVNKVCEEVVDDVQDALACGVVDLNTGMLMGVHHTIAYFTQSYLDAVAAAAVDMFRGKNVRRVEKMISKHRGKEVTDAFEEIFISSPAVFHFMKLIPNKGAVVVLVTRKTTNQGLGWASLRMAVDQIASTLP